MGNGLDHLGPGFITTMPKLRISMLSQVLVPGFPMMSLELLYGPNGPGPIDQQVIFIQG